jgi:3-oxoacyl-[acyl-carrier-protein] synthase II
MRKVVITGLGAVTPIGLTAAETWKNMLAGVNGIGPISRYDTAVHRAKLAAEVKGFDPDKFFDKLEVRKLDLYTQYAIVAAAEAVADSGIEGKIVPERFGAYVGSGVGGFITMANGQDTLRDKGPSRIAAATVPMMISNIASAHIAIRHKAKGPSVPIVTACATGSHSIGEAFLAIRNGMADAAIAGGAEAAINPLSMAAFSNMMALSTSADPDAASLPFDARRGGFVMGEGAGILVLEEYEHAKARGAKIYCELAGYGNTCDAYHITAPEPTAEGFIRMLKMAIDMAGVKSDDKIYINAHGTGTPLNDKTETFAIKAVFGEGRAKDIPCSSTKSMTGHMLGATGGVEAIAAVLALRDGALPPTINLKNADPECDLDYVPNVMRKYSADIAISTNLGFGGHNAGLVFRKM